MEIIENSKQYVWQAQQAPLQQYNVHATHQHQQSWLNLQETNVIVY